MSPKTILLEIDKSFTVFSSSIVLIYHIIGHEEHGQLTPELRITKDKGQKSWVAHFRGILLKITVNLDQITLELTSLILRCPCNNLGPSGY